MVGSKPSNITTPFWADLISILSEKRLYLCALKIGPNCRRYWITKLIVEVPYFDNW